MSQTLYRKYRPKKFDEVSGQEHIIQTLLNQIKAGKIAQAYLFTGPRGVGKTTTARLFAAAVNSAGLADEEIMEGRDLDVIEIDAASYSKVENVRESVIENARLTPNRRPYKIFIIDEVHMLSTSAFNALLKLIEEPPKHALFVLATTELHKVPATIVSRCQRFDFRKLTSAQIIGRLKELAAKENVEVEEAVFNMIAKRAEGSLRDGESILGQVLALSGSGKTDGKITAAQALLVLPRSLDAEALDLLSSLAAADAGSALAKLNSLAEQGADLNQFAQDILAMGREVMVCQHGMPGNLPDQLAAQVAQIAKQLAPAQTVRIIEAFAEQRQQLKNSIMPQLPLELAVVKSLSMPMNQPDARPVTHSQPQFQSQSVSPQAQPKVVNTGDPMPQPKVVNQKPETATSPENKEKKTLNEPDLSHDSDSLIGKIRQDWSKFLSVLQQQNASLVLILKTVEPLKIANGTLVIGFKYSFHKDRINSHDSRNVLEEKLSEFFGANLKVAGEVLAAGHHSEFIEAQTRGDEVELVADTMSGQNATMFVDDNPKPQEAMTQDLLIENLIKAFGGKVVE